MKVKVPRKLKKEKNKIEIHCYPHLSKNGFIKKEVVILTNAKVNKWTFKFVSKLEKELKEMNKDMLKKFVRNF